jgi:flagellar motor switch protein FliN/FliY
VALTGNERNNITEVLSQAVPNGASMLSELLGQPTTINIVNIESVDAGAVGMSFPGNNLVAPVELGGHGSAVLIVAQDQAAIMADLMIGQDGSNPPAVLEDLHLSAVTELTGQFLDAVMSNISSQVSKSLMTTPGEVTMMDLDAGIIPGLSGDVILMESEMSIGALGNGKLGIALSGEVASLLKKGAKAAAAAGGFVNDVTGGSAMQSSGRVSAQNVVTSELREERTGSVYDQSLEIVLDVPLNVTVELGRTEKLVREVLDMSPGSVIELDKLAGEPVDILVNNKYIAKGEVVVIDENFGIRITDIIRPADRIPRI